MRIVSWNLSHAVKHDAERRSAAWRHLASLAPDVAISQECGLPIPGAVSSVVAPTAPAADWATAVVSYGPEIRELDQPLRPAWNLSIEFRIPDAARPGTLAVAEAKLSGTEPVVVASLYGRLRYADQSVLRAASDILPVFDTALGRRVVFAGDLNIHTHSNDRAERRRAGPILGVLESFGLCDLVRRAKRAGILQQGLQECLQDCPCGSPDCSHVRTHRHPRHSPGAMANNDYMFATEELASRLTSLTVMNGDADLAWRHSDHAPIVAEFDR